MADLLSLSPYSRNVKLPFRCTGRSTGSSSATFGVVVFKGSMVDWRGVDLPLDLPVHINLFGVVVFKGSMVDWRGVDLPLDLPVHINLFGVVVFKGSMLDWGVDLPPDLPI